VNGPRSFTATWIDRLPIWSDNTVPCVRCAPYFIRCMPERENMGQ
jgi:hypothetical protein